MSIPEELDKQAPKQSSFQIQMQGHREEAFREIHKIFSKGPEQDSARTSQRIALGSLQDLLTRSCKTILTKLLLPGPLRRSSQEHPGRAFIQAPLTRGLWKIFMQEPAQDMPGPIGQDFTKISTRSSDKDLYKITQGALTGCHQDLHNIFSQGRLQPWSRFS